MSVFDEDNNLKNIEVPILIPQIREVLDFFIHSTTAGAQSLKSTSRSITQVLVNNGYDVNKEYLKNYTTIIDSYHDFLGMFNDKQDSYYTQFIVMNPESSPLDPSFIKVNMETSKIDMIVIGGRLYVEVLGNHIIVMPKYIDLPKSLNFVNNPTIVILENIDENKIRGKRNDCRIISWFDHWKNLTKYMTMTVYDTSTEVRSANYYDMRTVGILKNDSSPAYYSDGKDMSKYATVQEVYSGTLGGSLVVF